MTPKTSRLRSASALLGVAIVAGACGSSQPTQAGPAISSPPASTAAATALSPRSAAPSPSANPGTAATAAFIALVTEDDFAYQATFTGRSRHTTARLPVKGTITVS